MYHWSKKDSKGVIALRGCMHRNYSSVPRLLIDPVLQIIFWQFTFGRCVIYNRNQLMAGRLTAFKNGVKWLSSSSPETRHDDHSMKVEWKCTELNQSRKRHSLKCYDIVTTHSMGKSSALTTNLTVRTPGGISFAKLVVMNFAKMRLSVTLLAS